MKTTKKTRIKWQKISKSNYLSSEDVAVNKKTAYLPAISQNLTKKQLVQLFNQCTSALKKMANI